MKWLLIVGNVGRRTDLCLKKQTNVLAKFSSKCRYNLCFKTCDMETFSGCSAFIFCMEFLFRASGHYTNRLSRRVQTTHEQYLNQDWRQELQPKPLRLALQPPPQTRRSPLCLARQTWVAMRQYKNREQEGEFRRQRGTVGGEGGDH